MLLTAIVTIPDSKEWGHCKGHQPWASEHAAVLYVLASQPVDLTGCSNLR
jgi:hypothetical protein